MKNKLMLMIGIVLLVLVSCGSVSAAWWNISYSYKMPITCTNLDDKVPIVINNSDCFTIGGEKQCVWTYCDGVGTAIYYNNHSFYAVANDTTQLPHEVEFGNGTSYLPESVWDNNFEAVYLMDDDNSTAIEDSTSNNYDGTKTSANNPAEAEGMIGKAQNLSSDNINITGITSGTTRTVSMFVYSDDSPTASEYLFGVQTGLFVLYWENQATGNIEIYDGVVERSFGKTPTSGYWHSLVWVFNASATQATLFVNNTQHGAVAGAVTSRNIGGDVKIGSSSADTGYFDGIIDHITISNITRSYSFRNQTYHNILGDLVGYGELEAEEAVAAGDDPIVTTHATSPAIVYTTTDFKFNITVVDGNNATINAYVQFYLNGTASGAAQSEVINNDTNTLVGTMANADFTKGSELIAEYWASDVTNTSAKVNASTVTVSNSVPVITTELTIILKNADGTAWLYDYNATDADSDTITWYDNTTLFNINDTTGYINDTPTESEFGDYIILITAGDGSANTTDIYNYSLTDVTNPIMTISNFTNNKTIVFYKHNLTGQINFSDPNLYSINITLDSTILYNITNYNATLYVYNISYNLSSFVAGNYNLTARACDGHTTLSLKDGWDYDISFGSLTYKDSNKWYRINPTNADMFEKTNTYKLDDRYIFTYDKSWLGDFLTPDDKYTFIVESSEDIDIIRRANSKYNAWLVIPTIGSTGRWIDFNLKDVPDAKYVVTRLNDKQVRVTITNIPKNIKELVFESTGELNCVTEIYEYYVFNHSVTHDLTVLETSNQEFILTITRDSDFIDSANATLSWNGTLYSPVNTTTSTSITFSQNVTMPDVINDEYFLFYWNYTVFGNTTIEINTSNFNQTVYGINFDDCSIYNVTALNFSLFEESNNNSINGTMEFTFSLAGEEVSLNYSKSVTANSTRFCISAENVNFTTQMHSEFTAPGYDAHTYFAYNLAVDNVIDYIYYYLTNGTTIVTFNVLDQNGDDVEDAYIKVKKYDIGTNTYKTIETLKTDSQGTALGNIVLDIAWYEFVVEYGGTVYLTDGPTKITSTTRTFSINLLSDFFARYTDVIYGITSTLNYTDATGNFRFTWSDPDGNYHYGCLKVTKESIAGNTLINETCVASTASTILVNINSSGSVNGTYVAVGYIKFDDPYVLRILRKTWGSLSETFGSEGLFYGFLIILTVAMVGIFAPKIAMILAVIGLVFSSILGFFHMNPSWIVALILAAGLTIYRMRD